MQAKDQHMETHTTSHKIVLNLQKFALMLCTFAYKCSTFVHSIAFIFVLLSLFSCSKNLCVLEERRDGTMGGAV